MIEIWLTIISAFAAVAAAWAAVRARSAAAESRKLQFEAQRPKLSIANYGVRRTGDPRQTSTIELFIDFINSGQRIANEFTFKCVFVDEGFKNPAVIETEASIHIEIDSMMPISFVSPPIMPPTDSPKMFLILGVKFNDAGDVSRTYSQMFYLKWPGIGKGYFPDKFYAVSSEEKDMLYTKYRNEFSSYI